MRREATKRDAVTRRIGRAIAVALTACALAAAVSASVADAQTRAPKPARSSRPAAPKKPPKADAGAPSPPAADTTAQATAPRAEAAPGAPATAAPADAGAIEAKTLDGGTRVFRFGEIEIEGRLRNPQLVYFLRRVRAEFAAGDLGHRSFMRELSETRRDPSF